MRRFIIYYIMYKILCIVLSRALEYFAPEWDMAQLLVAGNIMFIVIDLTWLTIAIHTIPKGKYAILRVWFFYIIMSSSISIVERFTNIINLLWIDQSENLVMGH